MVAPTVCSHLIAGIVLVKLEIIERNLGKSEQDLEMFGNMRDEKVMLRKTSCFLSWTTEWMNGGSNNWNRKSWIK